MLSIVLPRCFAGLGVRRRALCFCFRYSLCKCRANFRKMRKFFGKNFENLTYFKNKNRIEATLKLRNLVNKKNNALNDVKKIQFIKLYRQTQKVKNDQNSRVIQHFIKEKLRRYFDKRE